MTSQKNGLMQLHISVLLLGGTALFSHLLPWSAVDITMLRCFFAAITLAIIVKLQGKNLLLNCFNDYIKALLLGIAVGLHWVTYFYALQLAGIAVGMLSFFCYPVITVFLEPLINRLRGNKATLHLRDLVSGVIVFIGVLLLVPELSMQNDTTVGVLIGVSSGFIFALRNILHKQYFSHYSGTQAMFYQTLVVSVMLLPFLTINPFEMTGLWQDNQLGEFALLLLLAVMFTAIPHAMLANSLRQLSAKTAGLISCLQPLYGTAMATVILSQWPMNTVYIGGSLIVAAEIFETVLVSRGTKPLTK